MADLRYLKDSYLREAATGGRTTPAEQLTWLESKRVAFQAEVDAGDWEVTSQHRSGRSTSSLRKSSALDRLKAVLAAMESVEETLGLNTTGSTSQMLGFRIHGIQN